MRTAVSLRNIVGITVQAFLKTVVPLQRDLNLYAFVCLRLEMTHFGNGRLALIEKFNKSAKASLIRKELLFGGALILEENSHPTIQKSELSKAFAQNVVVKCDIAESLGGGSKTHGRACLCSLAHYGQRRLWDAMSIVLLE